MQQRKQAKRQFAGVLANLCATSLGLVPSQGGAVSLDPSTPISCATLPGAAIWAKPRPRLPIRSISASEGQPWAEKGKAQLEGGAADVFGPGSGHAGQPAVDVKSLHAKIGELTLENDFLEQALTKAGLLSARK